MKIKRYEIGSDDDELTIDIIRELPTYASTGLTTIEAVKLFENGSDDELLHDATHSLEEFVDDEFWAEAYKLGYKTLASFGPNRNPNEIVYLVTEV